MKSKKLALFVLFTLSIFFAHAQNQYAFKVLANKGSNEVKSGRAWSPLKTGSSLNPEDEIKIASNSYLGLVHVTGKPLELKEANTYKVADLAKKITTGSGVIVKYTDFILSSNSAEAKKNHLSATGAVHRGEKSRIALRLPENQYSGIFNNQAIISWEGTDVAGPYTVRFKNMFDDELGKVETPERQYTLDLSQPQFAKENAVIVEVSSTVDPNAVSSEHLIKKLSKPEYDAVKETLQALQADASEETALNKLILAGFYEENKLLIDAITAYEEAIRLAPDVTDYKDAYDQFLIRHQISQ